MSVIVTVLYPQTEKSTFDLEYYMKTHMPLAEEKWAPHGMSKWEVLKLKEGGPYSIQAILYFPNKEAWLKAESSPETPTVMADVPNFSSESPILVVGDVVPKAA